MPKRTRHSQQSQKPGTSLYDVLRDPFEGSVELDIDRLTDTPRELNLFESEEQVEVHMQDIKLLIGRMSLEERLELKAWLDQHIIDLDAEPNLKELVRLGTSSLGDETSARRWLLRPNAALNGAIPAIYAQQSAERRETVVDLLSGLPFGNVS